MAYTTPLNQALTVRLSTAEKEQLLVRAGIESRQIGQMARLLILQGLATPPAPPVTAAPETTEADSGGPAQQQHATSIAAH